MGDGASCIDFHQPVACQLACDLQIEGLLLGEFRGGVVRAFAVMPTRTTFENQRWVSPKNGNDPERKVCKFARQGHFKPDSGPDRQVHVEYAGFWEGLDGLRPQQFAFTDGQAAEVIPLEVMAFGLSLFEHQGAHVEDGDGQLRFPDDGALADTRDTSKQVNRNGDAPGGLVLNDDSAVSTCDCGGFCGGGVLLCLALKRRPVVGELVAAVERRFYRP